MGTKEKAADAAQQEGDRAEGVEMSEGGGGGGGDAAHDDDDHGGEAGHRSKDENEVLFGESGWKGAVFSF